MWCFFWPWFGLGGHGERWKAVSDEEMRIDDAFPGIELSTQYLGSGDSVQHPDGSLYVVVRSGTRDTARVVRGRMKTPTELYP